MPKTIRQSATFKATPHQVYAALMDSRKHARFTGDTASISRKVGGKMMAYGGYITGTNVELVPDDDGFRLLFSPTSFDIPST